MANESSTLPETASCLAEETIRDYLRGQTDDLRAFEVEMHLAQCQRCEQTASQIDANKDSWAGLLADVGGGEESPLPKHIVDVLARIKNQTSSSPVRSSSLQTLAGKTVGPYLLEEPLGQGGMGVVFRARHQLLGKQFALKILPGGDSLSDEAFERFRREIAASGRLHHPSIVAATDAGEHSGLHYLAMEIVDGLNIGRVARRLGPLAVAQACEIIRQAALGLAHAHASGVVHRDIKPSNLMLAPNGQIKILDFGLAQLNAWNDPASELTTVGQLLGTLDYMAPEQAERGANVDHRADLYSLGATLYALLSGRAPYAATPRQSPLEKLRLMATELPPRIKTLCPGLPDDLTNLIHRLIERHADRRPSSAALVAEEIASFAQGADLVALLEKAAMTTEPLEVNVPAKSSLMLAALREPTKGRDGKVPRRPNWPVAALFAFFGLLAALGIWIVIETSKGQLIIETESANVQVKLLADGKEYDQLQLHPGANFTRLFAGKYEIVIDGAADQYAVDRNTISLRRGETIVARITSKPGRVENLVPQLTANLDPSQSSVPPANESVYNGKTLDQWLTILLFERSAQQRKDSSEAVRSFSSDREQRRVFDIVMESLHSAEDNDFRFDARQFGVSSALHDMRFDKAQAAQIISLLNPDSPRKTRWTLLLLERNFENLDSNAKESIFTPVAKLVEHIEVKQDDEIARSVGWVSYKFLSGKDEGISREITASATKLLATSDKLGPKFWFDTFGTNFLFPDLAVARRNEVIASALTDKNSSSETLTFVLNLINSFSLASDFSRPINALLDRLSSSAELYFSTTFDNRYYVRKIVSSGGGTTERQSWANGMGRSFQALLKNEQIDVESDSEVYPVILGVELVTAIFGQSNATAEAKTKLLEPIINASRDGFDKFVQALSSVPESVPVVINADDFSVQTENRKLVVSKQDVVKALVHVAAMSALDELKPNDKASSNQPDNSSVKGHSADIKSTATYGSRTLNEWLGIFRSDQKTETIRECVSAIEKLMTDADKPAIRQIVFKHFAEMEEMPVVLEANTLYARFDESLQAFSAKEELVKVIGLDQESSEILSGLLANKTTELTPANVHKAGWAAGTLNTYLPRSSDLQRTIHAWLLIAMNRPDVTVDCELARLYGVAILNCMERLTYEPVDAKRFVPAIEHLQACKKLGPEFWLYDAAVRRVYGAKTIELAITQIQNPEAPPHLRIKACRTLAGMVAASKTVPPEIIAPVSAALRSVINEKGFLAIEKTSVLRMNNSPMYGQRNARDSNIASLVDGLKTEGLSVQDITRFESATGGIFERGNFALEMIELCSAILEKSSGADLVEGLQNVVSATKERHANVVKHFDQTIQTGDYKNCWVEPDLQSIRFNSEPTTKVSMDDFVSFLIHRSAADVVEKGSGTK